MIKMASLPPHVLNIVQNKGTEAPFSNELNDFEEKGTYLCRQCGLALFSSQSKFHSGCGWPSFDEEIASAVLTQPDLDGKRLEIVCARCKAHLGHVFFGEAFSEKNTRHCVNGLSLDYVSDKKIRDTEEAIFAGGCFWGVEFFFKKLPGVLKTEVGYTGGHQKNPSYEMVCTGESGHVEALRVIYDPEKISYEQLTKFFFEIHDFSQTNGQGPDIGEQYLSVIFYYTSSQQEIAMRLIKKLAEKGERVATKLLPVSIFWRAETYHQDYYTKTGKHPYCHRYEKKFE